MHHARRARNKTHAALAGEGDAIAETRHRQISSGEDISFNHVVAPTALRLLEPASRAHILDIGCGTGDFALRLSSIAGQVTGIDSSSKSIALARDVCGARQNVKFVEGPFEDTQ